MPFTPFHLGPAAALKIVLPTSFSFTVFGFTQVLIDIEPLAMRGIGDGRRGVIVTCRTGKTEKRDTHA